MILAPNKAEVGTWTLQEVSECGALHVECIHCWKMSERELVPLIERFGADATLGEIAPCMRCTRCGRKKARVLVRLAVGVALGRGGPVRAERREVTDESFPAFKAAERSIQ